MSVAAINWAFSIIETGRLNASERLVLLALAHREHSKTRRCDPSVSTIAKMAGLSRPKASEAVSRLADMGVISVSRRTKDGAQISNAYHLGGVPSAKRGGVPSAEQAPCYDGATGGGVPSAEHNKGSLYKGATVVEFSSHGFAKAGGWA